jgi:hypothetical protein
MFKACLDGLQNFLDLLLDSSEEELSMDLEESLIGALNEVEDLVMRWWLVPTEGGPLSAAGTLPCSVDHDATSLGCLKGMTWSPHAFAL